MISRVMVRALIGFCLALAGAETVGVAQEATPVSVQFDSFVQWDFKHREKLRGWKTTAAVIEHALQQWYGSKSTIHPISENGSPAELRQFLNSLPTGRSPTWSLAYFATHQSPSAEWDFTARRLENVPAILRETRLAAHPGRIVIVDACHAESALEAFAPFTALAVFTAAVEEKTSEMRWFNRNPVDFPKRYPAATRWLKNALGPKWDGRISFFGFAFATAFCEWPSPPRDLDDWERFFTRCRLVAEEFRANRSIRLASRILVVRRASAPTNVETEPSSRPSSAQRQ